MVQLPVGPSYLELPIHPPIQEALSFPIQFLRMKKSSIELMSSAELRHQGLG
jgi:hypothetical protein